MGFLDKLKGAVNAVTGGAAKVTLEVRPAVAFPGESIMVKIAATSSGAEVKSKGIFADLVGTEHTKIKANATPGAANADTNLSKETLSESFQIAPEFVLAPNETKHFEGTFTVPSSAQPSYQGVYTRHEWQIRGRVEALGNDPDSGFQPIRIGAKS